MEDKLFTLLRIGLEITEPNKEDLSPFIDMSEFKWNELINIAQDQGVLGFTFDGIEKIYSFVEIKKNSTWFYEAYKPEFGISRGERASNTVKCFNHVSVIIIIRL